MDTEAPAENSAKSYPSNEVSVNSCTVCFFFLNTQTLPAERFEANNFNRPTGKSYSSNTLRIVWPTNPVAPTIQVSISRIFLHLLYNSRNAAINAVFSFV